VDTQGELKHYYEGGSCKYCGAPDPNDISGIIENIFYFLQLCARDIVGFAILIGWFLVGKDKKRYY
jgi:hypothetical protein